jgi:hypothetical protein
MSEKFPIKIVGLLVQGKYGPQVKVLDPETRSPMWYSLPSEATPATLPPFETYVELVAQGYKNAKGLPAVSKFAPVKVTPAETPAWAEQDKPEELPF